MNTMEAVLRLRETSGSRKHTELYQVQQQQSCRSQTHLIDNTDVSSFGFGRMPERSTSNSNDQNSKLLQVVLYIHAYPSRETVEQYVAYQTIAADGTASLMKLDMSCKASLEKPIQVFLQAGDSLTYSANSSTFVQ